MRGWHGEDASGVHRWVPALRSSVKNAAPRPGHDASGYFQTDLSASQRCPLNSLASASIEPLSTFASPSSSPPDSSARLSLAPAASSVVVMAGVPIQSIRRSDEPGLSGATSAVISMVSVRSSAGKIWLGRLKVSFSFPVLALQTDDD